MWYVIILHDLWALDPQYSPQATMTKAHNAGVAKWGGGGGQLRREELYIAHEHIQA